MIAKLTINLDLSTRDNHACKQFQVRYRISVCFHSEHFHTLNWETKDCNFNDLRLGYVSMPRMLSGLGLDLGIRLG